MVKKTLEAMARGGIYDQLGGGFHRYSVDNHWLVPHFEKMLYDNAQLAKVYLHAWQVTGEPFYRTIAEETLDYVAREMTSPEGGFYSTQDADSEGEEGRFYLWTAEEIRAVLGEDSEAFLPAYGVSEEGNFEGRNILKFVGSIDQRESLSHLRQKLFEVRDKRVHPARDEKILTSWNGLMLSAFSEAARVLSGDDYLQVAQRNAEFILSNLRTSEGRLLHVWKDGKAKINGYLEDYTHLIFGLLELYQTTFEPRWYIAARELAEIMLEHFSSSDGGFFDVSNDYESVLIRTRTLEDNALPSGNAMAGYVLLQLGGLANEPRYTERAHHILGQAHPLMGGYPLHFGQWLIDLDYALSHPREVAIVGHPEAADTRALLEECIRGYSPHQVVALGTPETSPIPLLQGRTQINEHATAYVCVDFTCFPPVTDPEALQKILK